MSEAFVLKSEHDIQQEAGAVAQAAAATQTPQTESPAITMAKKCFDKSALKTVLAFITKENPNESPAARIKWEVSFNYNETNPRNTSQKLFDRIYTKEFNFEELAFFIRAHLLMTQNSLLFLKVRKAPQQNQEELSGLGNL